MADVLRVSEEVRDENEISGWMGKRLDQLERVLSEQEWLAAERFTVADLLMADVLRVSEVRSFGDRPEASRRKVN